VDSLDRTVDAVRLSPAGPSRLAIAVGKLVRVYPVSAAALPMARDAKTIFTLPTETGLVVKVAWSPDGRRIVYGTDDGRVARIDSETGATVSTFPKHAREVIGIVCSSDGRSLVTADAECVRFSDVATTMMFDEVRPDWIIEDLDFDDRGDGEPGPLLVIAGSAAAPEGSGLEPRVGIFDLRRSLPPQRPQP
jgi:WD40 repeat protein